MTRVKQGDLAYLVGSMPEAGRVVEILRLWRGEENPNVPGPYWEIKSITPMLDQYKRMVTELLMPDWCLRPISGVPVHDQVTDEVTT